MNSKTPEMLRCTMGATVIDSLFVLVFAALLGCIIISRMYDDQPPKS